jgi:hypothetical protein
MYVFQDPNKLIPARFADFYEALREDVPSQHEQFSYLADLHKKVYDTSVQGNPYFWYGPFTGQIVTVAGYAFVTQMMSNFSNEYPQGFLSKATLASMFGVQGTARDNFVVKQGWERIPENWYRRPNDFTIPEFFADVLEHAAKYPELLNVGGNTGTVNSFTGVDLTDLTGGVFNGASLLQGDNLLCFAMQALTFGMPDLLGTTYADVSAAYLPLLDRIKVVTGNKACPQLQKYNSNLFKKYPGYAKSYGNYKGLPQRLLGILRRAAGYEDQE